MNPKCGEYGYILEFSDEYDCKWIEYQYLKTGHKI
jgi:hypothetical protein